MAQELNLSCPMPMTDYPEVLLAHGGGGNLMHRLLRDVILPVFGTDHLAPHDAAVLSFKGNALAFTTDSYVVHPLFFPGGDVGSLAVHGTVNDLAMAGARPLYLSAGFIIEEGLPMDTLRRVAESMQAAAQKCGVKIVTGDTKVLDRGKGDGLFINTSGVGVVEHTLNIGPQYVRTGDAIVVNGDVGRHGMAVMAVREGLEFESTIESDSAPLHSQVSALLDAGIQPHCLRDLTRGGLASVMNEIAEAANRELVLDERLISIREDVRAACEILGLDPFQVACEGRMAVFVPPEQAEKTVQILNSTDRAPEQSRPEHEEARVVGTVSEIANGRVLLNSLTGVRRIMDMPAGQQLPRIC